MKRSLVLVILSVVCAHAAHAGCASLYRKRSNIYINVEGTTASGQSIAISRDSDGPDFVRKGYVHAAGLLEQDQAEINKMLVLTLEKHLVTPAVQVEKALREALTEAEKQNTFCKDTDGDGEPDLVSFRAMKKQLLKDVQSRLQ